MLKNIFMQTKLDPKLDCLNTSFILKSEAGSDYSDNEDELGGINQPNFDGN